MSILKHIKSQLHKWIGLFISLLEWCFLVLKKEVIQTFPGVLNSGLWFPKLWLLQPSQRIHLVTLSFSVWCGKFLSYTMRNFGEDSNGCVLRLTSSWSRIIPSWCKKKIKHWMKTWALYNKWPCKLCCWVMFLNTGNYEKYSSVCFTAAALSLLPVQE